MNSITLGGSGAPLDTSNIQGVVNVNGPLTITPTTLDGSQIPLIVNGGGGDTQRWVVGGTLRSFVDVFGNFIIRNTARLDSASLSISVSATTSQCIVMRAVAGYATDYLRVEDSTSAVLLAITSTGGLSLANGVNIAVGTGAGTQIGTAAAQKLGFLGAAPIARQGAIAAVASGGAVYTQAWGDSIVTAVNALRAVVANFGFTS